MAPVLNLNNEVVKLRKEVKKIRVLTIRKLTRHLSKLKSKKGTEEDVLKNQRRAQRLLDEIHAMKELKPDDVTKTALQKEINFEKVCKKQGSTAEERAIARLGTHPQFKKKIDDIKAAVKAFKDERRNPATVQASVDCNSELEQQQSVSSDIGSTLKLVHAEQEAEETKKKNTKGQCQKPVQKGSTCNQHMLSSEVELESKLVAPKENTVTGLNKMMPASLKEDTPAAPSDAAPAAPSDAAPAAPSDAAPAARPGAMSAALSGAVSAALSGAVSAAVSAALSGAVSAALSGAVSSALSGAVSSALSGAVSAALSDAVSAALSASAAPSDAVSAPPSEAAPAAPTEDVPADRTEDVHAAPTKDVPTSPTEGLPATPKEGTYLVPKKNIAAAPKDRMPIAPKQGSPNSEKQDTPFSKQAKNAHGAQKGKTFTMQSKPDTKKKELDDDSSDIEESDEEAREYFDDSTEERFHKQSSGPEDSDGEDDFFIGKVKQTKKKKGSRTLTGAKTRVEEPPKASVKAPVFLSKRDTGPEISKPKTKAPKLESVFCHSLAHSKQKSTLTKRNVKDQPQRNRKEDFQQNKPRAMTQQLGKGSTVKHENKKQQLQQPLHPSWEASRKRKEQQQSILTAFQGKKIKFDD